jgi:ribonuclease HI
MSKLIINTDGGARGNPGPAGIGVVIRADDNQIIGEYKQYIGEATNNVAEYKALILALEKARELSKKPSPLTPLPKGEGNKVDLEIRMDSELVVRQMIGQYKIKEPTLKLLAAEVLKLRNQFKNVTFHHVPREQNKEADKLVNQVIDEAA